jgi:hypothetical protein
LLLLPSPYPHSPLTKQKQNLVLMLWRYDVQIIACHDLPLLL